MTESKTPTGLDFVDHRESCAYDRCRLHQAAPYLLEACKAIYECIESKTLVRSIAHDSEPGWAIRQLPLVRALGQLKEAIEKAEADHEKPSRRDGTPNWQDPGDAIG